MSSQTPEEIQADIERQREQLAQTVDQIGHKLDVKSQAKARIENAKTQTQARVADVRDRSTTEDGKPRPEAIGTAVAILAGVTLVIWLRRRR